MSETMVGEKDASRPVQVAIFSTHDTGGAGVAARRLHTGLRENGCRSEMYVAELRDAGEHVGTLPGYDAVLGVPSRRRVLPAWARIFRGAQARIEKEYPGRDVTGEMFSGAERICALDEVPFAQRFDIFHLHWVAYFTGLPPAPRSFSSPVVWTLHDMRPFTGGCHYADRCDRFIDHCGACPQIGSTDESDMSFATWREQMGAYRKRNLHIVTPSGWLAEKAGKSSLLGRFPISVIENGHPLHIFTPQNRSVLRSAIGAVEDTFVLGFSAENLRNKRKGMAGLIECLRQLAAGPLRDNLQLLLLGDNPPPEFMECGIRAKAAGAIADSATMAACYNMMDALIVPSREDNMPNVIAEAAGCGTPTIAFAVGGIRNMLTHGENGWLAPVDDPRGLVEGVEFFYGKRKDPLIRLRCRVVALERWNAPVQAQKYMDLYRKLLQPAQ